MEVLQHIRYKGAAFQVWRRHAWPAEPNGWHQAHSYCLVCPGCLRVWAEVRLDSDPWCYAVPGFCEECQSPPETHWLLGVKGSILLEEGLGNVDLPLLDALPEELLRREFRIHLQALEHLKELVPQEETVG